MTATRQHTADNLAKLNERLAVIDGAQKNITELASQVTSLQSVLSNKQSRGAFGQGRMEVIVQDGLPKGCYEFQYTLSNRSRPDCAIFLPDQRPLVIDAKFPLEAVNALRDAKTDDERKRAAARLRADINRHVADIAEKYLIPGETQDLALMFVPSESVYAELHDGFDDVVQKAYRAKVVIVSPSLLMLAINVVQQIQKDARMREAADKIHAEVGHLMDDIKRLQERVRAAAAAPRPGQRGRAANPHFGRKGGEERHAHPGGRVRRRRRAAGRQRHPGADPAQAAGGGVVSRRSLLYPRHPEVRREAALEGRRPGYCNTGAGASFEGSLSLATSG